MEKLILYKLCTSCVLLIFFKTAVCVEPPKQTVQDYNNNNSVGIDSSDGVTNQCSNCSKLSDSYDSGDGGDGIDNSVEFHGELQKWLEKFYRQDVYNLVGGVTIRRVNSVDDDEEGKEDAEQQRRKARRSSQDMEETQLVNQMERYARTHVVEINFPLLARSSRALTDKFLPRFGFGKNSFLTGFGLGFLAFGLKKLLLPLFIGAQIVKSVLIAMFLPSIIGAVGKLIGKGLTSAASSSGSSALHGSGNAATDTVTDFDFKENAGYDSDTASSDGNYGVWTYPPGGSSLLQGSSARQPFPAYTSSGIGTMGFNSPASSGTKINALDRYQQQQKLIFGDQLASMTKHQTSFYTKDKQQDFKVFHNIPSSSQLLANYDPFYSPLLSRLDSVFKQLGYFAENCRERLVCEMYNNPAKFAPFSNLVSAQLSRELNELRKPASDNPEILRFFRYMKAAKDGQDGAACDRIYPSCMSPGVTNDSPPMVTTFNDINKLVQARKLSN